MADDPPRLLLVEDDPELCRAVARILRREDLEVTAAPSCATARALTCWFDLGIFDIGLGDGDGVQLASSMLEDARVGRAVFFTAAGRASIYKRAAAVGPVVRKRDGVEALLQVVLGLLGRKAVTQSGIAASDTDEREPHRKAGKKSAG